MRRRFAKPFVRLGTSIRARGVGNTMLLAGKWGAWKLLPKLTNALELALANGAELLFDRRFGTETRSLRGQLVEDAPEHSRSDGSPYEATSPGALRLIVRSVTRRPKDWVFVDIGSGKGKVLMMAAGLGFREAFGVEHSPSLAGVAESNLHAYRQRRPAAPPIRSAAGDAATVELPAGPLFVYLFNSFGETVMRAFAANLERSLASNPRPLMLAYLNPIQAPVLDECTFLQRTGAIETLLLGTCYVYRGTGPENDCRDDVQVGTRYLSGWTRGSYGTAG